MKKRLTAFVLFCTLIVVLGTVCACVTEQYTVTFAPNYNGGTVVYQTGEKDATFTLPGSPTRDGYEFIGWFHDVDGTLPIEDSDLVFTANVTFYAKWKALPQALEAVCTDEIPFKTPLEDAKKLLKVVLRYFDGQTKPIDDFDVQGYDSQRAGKQTLTVTCTEEGEIYEAQCDVTVGKAPLESLTATYAEETLFSGKQLDTSKLTVSASFADGSTRQLNPDEYDVSGFDPNVTGEQTVTVSYTYEHVTKQAEFTVTVVKNTAVSLSATYDGVVVTGMPLNNDKITVSVVYADGSSRSVDGWTVGEFDSTSVGTQTVTVTYTEDGVTLTGTLSVTVIAKQVDEITVAYNGADVFVGGQLDQSQIVVTAHYNDGTSKPVSGWSVDGFDSSSVGDKILTVTYTEDDVTVRCTVTVKVVVAKLTHITAVYSGDVKYDNEIVSANEVTVTAFYEDGTNKRVTDFTFDNGYNSHIVYAGTNSFTVTFSDNGVTKSTTFFVTAKHNGIVQVTVQMSGETVWEREILDEELCTVTITYENGDTSQTSEYGYFEGEYDPNTRLYALEPGNHTLTFYCVDSWRENDETQTNVVYARSPVEVYAKPNKPVSINVIYSGGARMDVLHGEPIDKSSFTVLVTFDRYPDKATHVYDFDVIADVDDLSATLCRVSYTYRKGEEFETTLYQDYTMKVFPKVTQVNATYTVDVPVGKSLDQRDLQVELVFEDETTDTVASPNAPYIAFDAKVFDVVGEHTVHFSFDYIYPESTDFLSCEINGEFTVNVVPTKLTGITVQYLGGDIWLGDGVEETDLRVSANFDNGKSEQLLYAQFDFSPKVCDQLGEQVITVSYDNGDGQTAQATFTVNVKPWELKEIKAEYNGEDLEVGAQLDKSQLTVTAYYVHGATKQVQDFTVENLDTSTGGLKTFQVSYTENGKTARCSCTVNVVRRPTEMTVEGPKEVWQGTTLQKEDITVTMHFNDGYSYTVKSDFEFSPQALNETGNVTVTVTHTEAGQQFEAKFQVEVKAVYPESITALYKGGDILINTQPDVKMLEVTVFYNNETSKVVENVNVGTVDSGTVGQKIWEISYTEGEVTVSDKVTVNVVESLGPKQPVEGKYDVEVIKNEELSIHFLMLGNKYTGDSVYIKAGETDVLIDAGSKRDSATTISSYIDQYCSDGVLEYVVATHAHEDHIAGFVGQDGKNNGIFDKYVCNTIIDFTRKNTTSGVSADYITKRDKEVAQGANRYSALDCVKNQNGAQKTFELSEGITMTILYQKFYEQKASEENDYSVCLLISNRNSHYLFTGDLELEGEESLVENNPDLPEVELYKGGHHGSKTSSNEILMSKIKPKCVCVCTCMGSSQYNAAPPNVFPTQDFCNRVAPYTDRVYVTTYVPSYSGGTFYPANGNIVYACTNEQVTMYFSNNNLKLKDTEWFKANRTMPAAWAE